jgi:ribosomal protein RSM22 (predicted rRNA methylase)
MHPLDLLEQHLVDNILSPAAQAQYRTGDVSSRELAPFVDEVQEISARYLDHTVGKNLASPVRNLRAAQAYALYYTPINAAKIIHLLPQLLFNTDQLSVLDVGSGPGTVALALLAALNIPLELTCVESCAEMRSAAEQLLRSWQPNSMLKSFSVASSLDAVSPHSTFNLVVAANVLAELSEQEGQRYLTSLAHAVAPGGFLLLLEPGQLAHTRRLMQLRDQLVQQQTQLTPIYPCLRADLCPMLQDSQSDWCHGELEWYQPRLNAQLDKLLRFNKHRIKFSSFIFERGGALRPGMRVITPPKKTARGVESLVCGQGLYGVVRIAKRNRSVGTRAFEKASVFDRLIFSEPCVGEAPAELVVSLAAEER